MRILEQFLAAKSGRLSECEDRIHLSRQLVAVMDGATPKTELRIEGLSPGAQAVRCLDSVFSHLPARSSALQAVRLATEAVQQFYKRAGLLPRVRANPVYRASASFAAYSAARRELWAVGDCQFLVEGRLFSFGKKIDGVLARARAVALELALLRGATVSQLRRRDAGREFIRPWLERQMACQNNPKAGEWSYPVIDGFPVARKGIVVVRVPQGAREVVLATDGYPVLKPTLKASEASLRALLKRDPLLFRRFQSTKGLMEGAGSFDDRAYVRLKLD